MISAAQGDGVADLKRALGRGDAGGPVALPRGRGLRRHRPHDRRRADPRADRQPAPPGAALRDRGRDRDLGGPPGRLDRDPPADPGRARQPEGDRHRQGRAAAQGDRRRGPRGDRRSTSAGRCTCSCTSRSTRAGTRTAASIAKSGWSGRTSSRADFIHPMRHQLARRARSGFRRTSSCQGSARG